MLNEKQISIAGVSGFDFIWFVETEEGKSGYQFNEDGKEIPLTDLAPLVKKPLDDPYYRTAVFKGVKRAAWVPVKPGLKEFFLDFSPHEGLVIFRRNYMALGGTGDYKVYCLGKRTMSSVIIPVEDTCYVCPPTQWIKKKPSGPVIFPGSIERSTDPDFENAYERFIKGIGK